LAEKVLADAARMACTVGGCKILADVGAKFAMEAEAAADAVRSLTVATCSST